MNIIKTENGILISGKELHESIGMKRDFSTWIKSSLEKTFLEEDKDYYKETKESTGGRPSIDYILTLDSAIILTIFSNKSEQALKTHKFLSELKGANVIQLARTRKEILFEIDLNKFLHEITEVVPQYRVLDYRVDFYLPEYNLVIEYDEPAHAYYKNEEKRKDDIMNYLQCCFLRVKAGEELDGLSKLFKYILHNILINYKYQIPITEEWDDLAENLNCDINEIVDCGKYVPAKGDIIILK